MNSVEKEVLCVRKSTALFPNFPRGWIEIRGKDRAPFLHNLVSHDIKGLPPGQGRLACLLDRQGKIQVPFLVHALSEALLLEMEPSLVPKLLTGLQQYHFTEEVKIEDVTPRTLSLPLHGPLSPEILTAAWPGAQLPLSALHHIEGPLGSGISFILRWDLFRIPGYHLILDPGKGDWVVQQLRGAFQKVRQKKNPAPGCDTLEFLLASPEAFETLRIEAGVPWPGKEIDETVILNELGTEDMVSFTKGCFVGQEIVARIKYRAHPPRLLTGFFVSSSSPVPDQSALVNPQGKAVGNITSSCYSPTLARVIALGFLKFETKEELQVHTGQALAPATATDLPFV